MQNTNPGFVIDVATDGTPRFRAVSRFEKFLEPGILLVVGLVALLVVINF